MSDNNHIDTIHDFDFDLICEYFSGLDRQGPGSEDVTLKALGFMENLSADSRIADLGCGSGGQTMTLAAAFPGSIAGLDMFPKFIDKFNAQATEKGFAERVKGVVGSMDALPFSGGELDAIWCEGAIYNIGFERGLEYWRPFLKSGGYVAVSENSWFTDERPKEIADFWNAAYPEIDTVPGQVAIMQRTGYEFIAAFKVPEKCWFDFYAAQRAAQPEFLKKHADNPAALKFIESERYEESLYNKYSTYYGYTFYIGRKI